MTTRFVHCLATALFMGSGLLHAAESAKQPVQVFILAGQSNMQGQGAVSNIDYLISQPETAAPYKHLKDAKGNWVVRDDVWIACIGRDAHGGLSVGYGRDQGKIGPELGFGWRVGDALDKQVLLIKTSWGGRSLIKDYLPPSSGGPGSAYTELVEKVRQTLGSLETLFPEYKGQGYELRGFVWF